MDTFNERTQTLKVQSLTPTDTTVIQITKWSIARITYPEGTKNDGECFITLTNDSSYKYKGDIQGLMAWLNK